jgi:hypothetical protein
MWSSECVVGRCGVNWSKGRPYKVERLRRVHTSSAQRSRRPLNGCRRQSNLAARSRRPDGLPVGSSHEVRNEPVPWSVRSVPQQAVEFEAHDGESPASSIGR